MASPFFALFVILLQFSGRCIGKRTWDFELLSITNTCPNENLINGTLKVERIGRGKSAISGAMEWKFDADDSLIVKLRIHTSQSGRDDDYKSTPYQIPDIVFNEYMKKHYQEICYKNVATCSNAPNFEGGFDPPFPQNTYTLNRCEMAASGFPDVLPVGYYKIFFSFSGQAEFSMELIVKLTPKMF